MTDNISNSVESATALSAQPRQPIERVPITSADNDASLLPSRLLSLDFARGFASLVVVFWHWPHFFSDHYEMVDEFALNRMPFYTPLWVAYTRGGPMAVNFFFVLSGFVFFWLYKDSIESRKCTARKFAILRFARLYPLHLLTLIAVAVLQWLYFRRHDSYFVYSYNDTFHFVSNLFFLTKWGFQKGFSYNAPVWSISIEIGLYVMFFVAAYFHQATFRRSLFILLSMMLLQSLKIGGNRPLAVEAFFAGGLTWYFGKWYSNHRHFIVDAAMITTALAAWTGIVSSERIAVLLGDGDHVYILFTSPITIIALVLCERSLHLVFQKVEWIGEITYSTYLLHFPLQLVFILALPYTGYDRSVFFSEASVLLFFAVLLPASYLTFHFFERPAQSWIRARLL